MGDPSDLHSALLWGVSLLGGALGSSFGPLAREKLLLTAARKAVITSGGANILSAVVSQHPVESLVLEAVSEHDEAVGDGVKAYALMLDAARAEIGRQLHALPEARRAAWRVRLSRAICWLQLEMLPHALTQCWRDQALPTAGASDAIRTTTHRIVATALGVQLGVSASASLTEALVNALLPLGLAPWHLDGVVARARCMALIAAQGAQPCQSCATDGRLIGGAPPSELMPASGAGGALLLLGAHAASPEVQTAAEARAAESGTPAEVVVSVERAPERAPGGREDGAAAVRLVEAVHASRAAWVQAVHAAGVRLLLSGAPLSALTVQLCAQHGVCAVPGVDVDDLRALASAGGISVLQRWPRPNELAALLSQPAGFVRHGCSFECLRLGGQGHLRVQLVSAPQLCSLVVRAPSAGLAREYSATVSRALRSVRLWLDAGDRTTDDAAAAASVPPQFAEEERVLLALPGAGAAEMQLEACVRRLIGARMQEGAAATSSPTGLGQAPLAEHSAALHILAAALVAPVRQLHTNAMHSRALSPHVARWPSVLQSLRAVHDRSPQCALGLVMMPQAPKTAGEVHLLALADAAVAGVLEPLDVKLRLLDGVLGCLAQLLLVDGIVPVRQGRLQAAARRNGSMLETSASTERRQRLRRRDAESESEEERGNDGEKDGDDSSD